MFRPAYRIAACGLAALAIAIGVGRLAFTPLFPPMQDELGVSVSEGGWLASANYAGYLWGSLAAIGIRMRPASAIRAGLSVIGVTTLAMAFCNAFAGWLLLRALAGAGSAWVLVFASAWALEQLSADSKAHLRGVVFAGVGLGIAAAGLLVAGLIRMGAGTPEGWLLLGLVSLALGALIWPAFGERSNVSERPAPPEPATRILMRPESVRLLLSYGAAGFGYIIPATFLPVMARQVLGESVSFEWAWPVFGAAAAVSTLVSGALFARVATQQIWIAGHVTMAAGLLLPVALPGLGPIIAAALLVGSTFMVITLAGLQRAREVGGTHATRLMAAMTSAFAVGQILGPLAATYAFAFHGGFSIVLCGAAAMLLLSACALARGRKHEAPCGATI